MDIIKMRRKHFLQTMAQSLKKKEMISKNGSFVDVPKASELQVQISSLTDQNLKLSEEANYWKDKYIDVSKQLSHSEEIIKQLRKSLVDFKLSKPVSNQSLARKEEQIQKNYEQVIESIGIMQSQTKKLFSQREERIVQAYDMKVSNLIQEEREKLKAYLDIDKEKEIAKLNMKVEGLGAKILYFEQLNEDLLTRNKSYKQKLTAYSTENEALLKRLSSTVRCKSGFSRRRITTASNIDTEARNYKNIESKENENKVRDFLKDLRLQISTVKNNLAVDRVLKKIDDFVVSHLIETASFND